MIVAMQEIADEGQIQQVIEHLVRMGFEVHRSTGARQTVLGAVGAGIDFDIRNIELMPGVQEVHRISSPYKLAGKGFRPEGTIVKLANGIDIGGNEVVVMAGPCSVESREQLFSTAEAVAKAGARVLRGGAFKPRSSPYSFQGHGEDALKLLREAGEKFRLLVISEVMEISQIPMMLPYVDILQVGARNMQNFNLLRELGKVRKPVLVKRGIAATLEELLLSAEYIMAGGNYEVILCERGIRTFETYTRNTMDISAIPIIHKLSHLPMTADPSHGTGRRDKVAPMARASVAAGDHARLVKVHCDPNKARAGGVEPSRCKIVGYLGVNSADIVNKWISCVSAEIPSAVYTYSDDLSSGALEALKSHAALFFYPGSDLARAMPALSPYVIQLNRAIENAEFSRFEQHLLKASSVAPAHKASDEQSDFTALNPSIEGALKEAAVYLRSEGTFDPKKAADLLRSSIDESHREIVRRLVDRTGY